MPPHKQIEEWWKDYLCDTDDLAYLDLNGRYPVRVQKPLEAATIALGVKIVDTGYRFPMSLTGSYNCRKIGGSDTWSLHAYAVAVDWDYPVNPYFKGTTIPRGFGADPRFELSEANITAVESIVNVNGSSIWKWAGYTIGDTMHFQVDVPPDKCQPVSEEQMFKLWAQGLVETWAEDRVKAEDEFMRLASEGLLGGDVGYWLGLLDDPANDEWTGMVGRTLLSSWHRNIL